VALEDSLCSILYFAFSNSNIIFKGLKLKSGIWHSLLIMLKLKIMKKKVVGYVNCIQKN